MEEVVGGEEDSGASTDKETLAINVVAQDIGQETVGDQVRKRMRMNMKDHIFGRIDFELDFMFFLKL